MREAELLACCMEEAKLRKWLTYHPLPARVRKRGVETYRTQASGDGKGYPDLDLVRDREEHWELKTEVGELDPDQIIWRDRLLAAGAVWRLVRPSDWLSGRVSEWLA